MQFKQAIIRISQSIANICITLIFRFILSINEFSVCTNTNSLSKNKNIFLSNINESDKFYMIYIQNLCTWLFQIQTIMIQASNRIKKDDYVNSTIENNVSGVQRLNKNNFNDKDQSQRPPESNVSDDNKSNQQFSGLQLFKQQMLRAWQPVPTLTKTILLFFIMALIFLGIGIPMLILSTNIIEYSVRYDNALACSIGSNCSLTLTIDKTMTAPVFVYYQIHNYYQNHRLYAKSFSSNQLKGESLSVSDIQTDCDPIVRNSDLYVTTAIDNVTTLIPTDPANPCGIIAWTVFNDSYTFGSFNIVNDNSLNWPSDSKKYKLGDISKMWYNVTNPRFINWMRIAAMPTFRKLWGKIENDIQPGNYTLTIKNNYDISKFNGQKYFVVSTSNFFGSKNEFLSITYIVVGGLCLVIAIIFLIKKVVKKVKSL